MVLVKTLKYVREQKAALAQTFGFCYRHGVREETSPVERSQINKHKARGEKRFSPDYWADLTCLVATRLLVWDGEGQRRAPLCCVEIVAPHLSVWTSFTRSAWLPRKLFKDVWYMRSKVPLAVALARSEDLPVVGPEDLTLMPLENKGITNDHVSVSRVICIG